MGRKVAISTMVGLMMLLGGCAVSGKDIQISSLAQQKNVHETIRILQADVDRRQPLSSFQWYLLAGSYYEVRDYDRMSAAVEGLEHQIAAGDSGAYGADLSNYPAILRGYAFLDQEAYGEALRVVSPAWDARERPGSSGNNFQPAQLIDMAGILGVAHARMGQRREAARFLAFLRQPGVFPAILGPEQHMAQARIYMAMEDYPRALAAVQDPAASVSGDITAFYDQTFQELPRLYILAKSLYETGRTDDARKYYDELLRHPHIKETGGIYWSILLDRARIAQDDGDPAAAESMLREAVRVIEQQRATIRSEAGRIGYVGDKQAVYQELVSLLIAENRSADAFEYVERSKGRALVDLLAAQKNIAVHAADAAGAFQTFGALQSAEKALATVNADADAADTAKTRSIVISLKHEIAAQAPEFTSLIAVTETPLSDILSRLARDEVLVEYYTCGNEWFAFVLSGGRVRAVPLGPLDLVGAVAAYRKAVTTPAGRDERRLGQELYRQLIAPASEIRSAPRLTIVPHGPLHYLPFAALSNGDADLIDSAVIRILPTASVLKFLKTGHSAAGRGILVMGDPDLGDPRYRLKYAEQEALAIAGIMPDATLLLRKQAQAAFIRENAGRYAMLHLATHGVFDPAAPLNSALLLAPGPTDDGRLTAGDLYRLDLDADLVTLSACDTALGKITGGDDVVGFTRGLLYAGARTIIATLWQVDDQATKELMQDFYGKVRNMAKGKALRQAQLDIRKRYPHPYYWASFQLTGNME